MIVIDASAALAWLLPSQSTAAARAFLRSTIGEQYVAPFVFDWEVRNVLLAKVRSGALNSAQLDRALDELETFAIVVAEAEGAKMLTSFARSQMLSLFDASYLAMALQLGAAIASLDRGLLSAAGRCGADVYNLRDDR